MRAVCWIRTTCSPAAVAQRVRAAGEGPMSRHSWDSAAACSANWPPGYYSTPSTSLSCLALHWPLSILAVALAAIPARTAPMLAQIRALIG